ncbi:unnamed protein product [Peniophora sp. CBMAI 1063]|nr:unnamed protein product [Peniophora sp. CBMAI 1063]
MSRPSSLVSAAVPPLRHIILKKKVTAAARPLHLLRQGLTLALARISAGPLSASGSGMRASRPRTIAAFSTVAPHVPHSTMRRSTTVLFKGFPGDVSREEVEVFFSDCGDVRNVTLRVYQYITEISSGYVRFASQDAVDRALQLDGKEALGKPLHVSELFEHTDTINVGPTPRHIDKARVKALFSSCGEVVDVQVHTTLAGFYAGKSYALVRFASPSSVAKALKRPITLSGKRLYVARAKQRNPNVSLWDEYAHIHEGAARSVSAFDLPPQVNDIRLKAEFESCGEIEHAHVWRALRTGTSIGVGWIRFSSPESVEKALQLNGKTIDGHCIRVHPAPPSRPAIMDYPARPTEYEQTKKIFVGRLPHDIDASRLRREFERFGRISDVRLGQRHETGSLRGFAYINFVDPRSVEEAVQHDGKFAIDGFTVKIVRDYAPKKKPGGSANTGSREPDGSLYDSQHRTESWEYDY